MRKKEVMLTTMITKEMHERMKRVSNKDDIPMSYITRFGIEKELLEREKEENNAHS